jgi:hypothetical protein
LGLDDAVLDVFVAGQTEPIMRYINGRMSYLPSLRPDDEIITQELKL